MYLAEAKQRCNRMAVQCHCPGWLDIFSMRDEEPSISNIEGCVLSKGSMRTKDSPGQRFENTEGRFLLSHRTEQAVFDTHRSDNTDSLPHQEIDSVWKAIGTIKRSSEPDRQGKRLHVIPNNSTWQPPDFRLLFSCQVTQYPHVYPTIKASFNRANNLSFAFWVISVIFRHSEYTDTNDVTEFSYRAESAGRCRDTLSNLTASPSQPRMAPFALLSEPRSFRYWGFRLVRYLDQFDKENTRVLGWIGNTFQFRKYYSFWNVDFEPISKLVPPYVHSYTWW